MMLQVGSYSLGTINILEEWLESGFHNGVVVCRNDDQEVAC